MYLKNFSKIKLRKIYNSAGDLVYYALRRIDKEKRRFFITTLVNRHISDFKLKPGTFEFYDVDIFGVRQGLCKGKCPYCYLGVNSNTPGYVKDAARKITTYFGSIPELEKPFQVALPGSGEFFEHPEWQDIIEAFNSLDIVPNITSNGMFIEENFNQLDKIQFFLNEKIGGIAISLHPHLKKYWEKAIDWLLSRTQAVVNLHIILFNRNSVEFLKRIYQKYIYSGNYDKNKVTHITLLAFKNGRNPYNLDKHILYQKKYLKDYLTVIDDEKDYEAPLADFISTVKGYALTYGAGLYSFLTKYKFSFVNLYKPETFSAFLDLKDLTLYNNSFDLKKLQYERTGKIL